MPQLPAFDNIFFTKLSYCYASMVYAIESLFFTSYMPFRSPPPFAARMMQKTLTPTKAKSLPARKTSAQRETAEKRKAEALRANLQRRKQSSSATPPPPATEE